MNSRVEIATSLYHAPCGDLLLGAAGGAAVACDWTRAAHYPATLRRLEQLKGGAANAGSPCGNGGLCESDVSDAQIVRLLARQLDDYFAGSRREFSVPVAFPAATAFEAAVWGELMRLPYGTLATYSDIARAIGRPTAVRAVARAIGANPISIVVPCHRVVGKGGQLTGYAGGIEAKRYLIALESDVV